MALPYAATEFPRAAANDNMLATAAPGRGKGWVEFPLGRLLASESTGTPEQRRRWIAAASWYEDIWSAASIPLRGAMLCKFDDLMNTGPYSEGSFVLAQRWSKGKRKGPIRVKGVHPDTIHADCVNHAERLMVAKLDAAPALYEVNKALGRYHRVIDWAIPQAMTMGVIGQRLGYSEKYAEQKGKEAVLAGLNVIADFRAKNIFLAA
jgi:hypothetical protein